MPDALRIGQGWDNHRLVAGRPLVLGGLTIPHDRGLAGHSDADVLTHALIDALLGAMADGDIGSHFPDSDARWRDVSSMKLLSMTIERVVAAGWQVGNVDLTLVAEAPRIGPHREEMRRRLAQELQIDPARISIKAKTAEGCGPEGRGETISAQAIVLLSKNENPGQI